MKKRRHGVLTPCAEARPTHYPYAYPPNHDDAGGRRDDVRPHGAPRAVTEALPGKGQPGSRPQPDNSRCIDRHQFAPFTAQTHRLDWQVGNAPGKGLIKQGIERHLAPLHRPLDPVPAPAQMHDKRQDGAGQAPFVMHQPTGHHNNQDHANTKGSARR